MFYLGLFDELKDALAYLSYRNPEPKQVWDCSSILSDSNNRRFWIGRSKSCTIQLESQSVSRKHLEIVKISENLLCVVDNHSTNGVLIDDRKSEYGFIQHGSVMQVAEFIFLLYDDRMYKETDPSKRTITKKP